MSLGQQLAPQLPFLRRFGRGLLGSQAEGDKYVSAALETIVANPASFPRNVDPRVGLYRMFLDRVAAAGASYVHPDNEVGLEAVSRRRLAVMPSTARAALLLTAMEGFSREDTGYLLDAEPTAVDVLVAEALAEIERQTRARVMIVEDEQIIAMELEQIVSRLGHEVVGVAVTEDEAIKLDVEEEPDLILMDILLADNSSGIDAAGRILARNRKPLIFITAFPERLLIGERIEPTFLITKPYQQSTVKAAISQALFFDERTAPTHLDPQEAIPAQENAEALLDDGDQTIGGAVAELAAADLAPSPAPIRAELRGAQLHIAPGPAIRSKIPERSLEVLRTQHLVTAERLCASTTSDNLGMPLRIRLAAVRNSLLEPIDDAAGLTLGVQADALRRMLPAVHEQLSPETATDIDVFVTQVLRLAGQFPDFEQFVCSAPAVGHSPEQRTALVDTAKLFEAQPDEVVDPALKAELAAVRVNAEDNPDGLADLALERTIGNVLKPYGEFLAERLAGVKEQTWKTYDRMTGGLIGAVLSFLFPSLFILAGLALLFPQQFGFVVSLMKLIKLMVL